MRNGMEALYETISALEQLGHPVPQPSSRASKGQLIELPGRALMITQLTHRIERRILMEAMCFQAALLHQNFPNLKTVKRDCF